MEKKKNSQTELEILSNKDKVSILRKGKIDAATVAQLTNGLTIDTARKGLTINKLRASIGIESMTTVIASIRKAPSEPFNAE